MQAFQFSLPTKVYFGNDQLTHLPDVLAQYGHKVLLTYGGGSIKKTGLHQELMNLLQDFEIVEFGGIEPNPRVETLQKGGDLAKEVQPDVILAVGGGSTIDCSKGISALPFYEGKAWEMVMDARHNNQAITKAIPLVTILTLSATGSETNAAAVVQNDELRIKAGFYSPHFIPKASFMIPRLTYTVPTFQTAAGSADIMSHIFEVYFRQEQYMIPTEFAESLLRTVIHYAPIALEQPDHYEARANLMWAGSLAINGLIAAGQSKEKWSCHAMEHELSAHYDITHGAGLALLIPHWMRHVLNDDTLDTFVRYGIKVWDIDANQLKQEIANQAIDLTEDFFKNTLQIPMKLSDYGINEEKFEVMAKQAVELGNLHLAYVPLNEEDVLTIYNKAL